MNVPHSANIQQNAHSMSNRSLFFHRSLIDHLDPNNLMNSLVPNLTATECRQSEEINNQMMNCLRYIHSIPCHSHSLLSIS